MRHFCAFMFLDGSATMTMTTVLNIKLRLAMPFDAGTAAQLSLVIDIAAIPFDCSGLLTGFEQHDGKSQLRSHLIKLL